MESSINIALVKYWGKAHETLIIPTNSSFSITLNKSDLCSATTVTLTDDISDWESQHQDKDADAENRTENKAI